MLEDGTIDDCAVALETCSHKVAGTCWLLFWFLQCNVEGWNSSVGGVLGSWWNSSVGGVLGSLSCVIVSRVQPSSEPPVEGIFPWS